MTADLQSEIRSLAFGVRVIAVGFILMMSAFNIRECLQIGWYRQLFADVLPGQTLPVVTNFIIQERVLWTSVAVILPVAAVAIAAAVRNNAKSLICLTVLMILIFAQANVTTSALLSPMFKLMNGMAAGPN